MGAPPTFPSFLRLLGDGALPEEFLRLTLLGILRGVLGLIFARLQALPLKKRGCWNAAKSVETSPEGSWTVEMVCSSSAGVSLLKLSAKGKEGEASDQLSAAELQRVT